ncbi:hypothetical protein BU24DRAFT_418669 [Aaosphaeria arxii CBS 175.79]|uniref:F-box domain-containing protein n=1 Tax=Aaosphaeria arxii CBS 175.79 TaxID=1450172 RepID=A0A6A5Y1C9_9PLEO|nr:uncharacterized protein BU24DRAFT_418669 [Aaosphaeria arxii CBS 175.79]KAF2019069.1 hypothetical protein BU24DRAFT_418669 [Aaosphaeria arxii CBS 175.79]
MPASLMALSTELRLQIISYVLLSPPYPLPVPSTSPTPTRTTLPSFAQENTRTSTNPFVVWRVESIPTHNLSLLPLLLTCRQIAAETRDVVSRHNIAIIDFAVVDRWWILPTPRYIPLHTTIREEGLVRIGPGVGGKKKKWNAEGGGEPHHLNDVEVNVTLYHTMEDREYRGLDPERTLPIRAPVGGVVRYLETLLRPNIECRKESAGRDGGIGVIRLNFETERRDWHRPIPEAELPVRFSKEFKHLDLSTLMPMVGDDAMMFVEGFRHTLGKFVEESKESKEWRWGELFKICKDIIITVNGGKEESVFAVERSE